MEKIAKKINKKDYILDNNQILFYVLILYLIGVYAVLSSSSATLVIHGDDPYSFMNKQVMFGGMALVLGLIVYNLNLSLVLKNINIVFYATVAILVVVLFTAKEVNGATSWFQIGGFGLQPSEFAKIVLIFCMAHCLKTPKIDMGSLKKAMLYFGTILALVVLQSDLGSAMIMAAIGMVMLFVAGTRMPILLGLSATGLVGLFALAVTESYRWKRLTVFLDPFQDKYGFGYQIIQSLYAIANGGFIGKGFGNSIQKYGFLPENHTDFVFSVFTEETGLVGAVVLISVFFLLIIKMLSVSSSIKNNKQLGLIIVGIATLIGVEAAVNLSVTVSLLPVTGVTLPFVSYGGSSLLAKSMAIAIVLNISKNSPKKSKEVTDKEKELNKTASQDKIASAKSKAKYSKDMTFNKINTAINFVKSGFAMIAKIKIPMPNFSNLKKYNKISISDVSKLKKYKNVFDINLISKKNQLAKIKPIKKIKTESLNNEINKKESK